MIRRSLLVAGALALLGSGAWLVVRSDGANPSLAAATSSTVPTTTSSSTTIPPPTTAAPATTTTTVAPVPLAIPQETPPHPDPPQPSLPEGWDGHGVVTVAAGGADLVSAPGQQPFMRAREGLVLAGRGSSGDGAWIRVFHMCDGVAWVRSTEVEASLPAEAAVVGAGVDFADAVIVVDPGHGGPNNVGAVAPDGLPEKLLNVEIAARLRHLLSAPRSVDWDTGQILDGADIPAARSVIVTRSGLGEEADYEAGLDFRAALANSANAHAMVAVHNNAGWEVDLDVPGSDVYYQSQAPVYEASRRLATLIVEEMRRGFAEFDASWVGAIELGAKSRISPRDGVSQYYGVLKAATVPTVIAEGAYISNPTEAELLRTAEFQHAYAAALYRALVRFVTTDEPGAAPSHDPEVWDGFAGSGGARPECEIPAQP